MYKGLQVATLLMAAGSVYAASATAQPATDFDQALPPLEATAPPAAPVPSPYPRPPAPQPTPLQPPLPQPDAELAQPLPPLATFQADPPAPAPRTAAADEQTPAIRYRTEITGLEQIGLDKQFRSLSALVKDGDKAANAAQVGARADEDVKLAERMMRAHGYFDAIATASIDPVDQNGQARATITATPGALYGLAAITVTGAPPEPAALALKALDLKTGDAIIAAEIETAEANVALRLPEQGYPFVAVGQRDILLDEATHKGDYSLPVNAGAKSVFGGFRTAGDPIFDTDHVAVFPRFRPGQLYDARKVDDMRQALVATGMFSTVSVEPVATGTAGPDGTEVVDLLVRQSKGPWRTLAGSVGYATGQGLTVTGLWTHRNRFPPEGALGFTAVAGTQEQSLGASFRRSNAGKRDRTVQAAVSVARQRFQAYDANTVNLSASIARQSTPIWQKRWTYSLGGELIATREDRYQTATLSRTNATYYIAALPMQLGHDRSDSLLDPTKGFRITARLSPEAQKRASGGFDSYARVLVETSTYWGVSDSIVLAGRSRLGSIVGAGRDAIAPSRRLYSGGGGSVRGFGYQQLGPKDVNNNPVGGRSLTEFAGELRYRFGNFGIVSFFDAGRVGEASTPGIGGMRYGAGIGGRYYTNFGPMRVDIATPINRQPGESKIALYISIGQAF